MASERRRSFLRDDHSLREAKAEQIRTFKEVGVEGYSGFAAVKDGLLALLFQSPPRPAQLEYRAGATRVTATSFLSVFTQAVISTGEAGTKHARKAVS